MKKDKKIQQPKVMSLPQIILNSKQFKNTMLGLLVIVFVGGYALFFSSHLYMPTNMDNLKFTALNSTQKMDDNHQFTILRWDYSESQRLMEIELDVENTAFDGNTTFEYAAKTNPSGKIKVTPIIEEESYIVLQLSGIPKDFIEISFRISMTDNKEAVLKLYTNTTKIKKTDNIQALSKLEYQIKRLNRNIDLYRENIESYKKTINEKESTIANIQEQNISLENEKLYLTESEITKQNQRISSNEQLILQNQSDIDALKKSIMEEENKVALAETHLKDLQ